MVRQWWFSNGGPTEAQRTRQRWANNALIVGVPLGQRWVNRGLPVASHRWPNSALIVGVPLGQRWLATGGPTEAHRWLATVGPTVGQQRRGGHAHSGPPVAATVGPSVHVPLAHQSNAIWV